MDTITPPLISHLNKVRESEGGWGNHVDSKKSLIIKKIAYPAQYTFNNVHFKNVAFVLINLDIQSIHF